MTAVNQELVKKIKGYFDLNIYETKVWLALLTKGVSSAGEIAEISGVPRSRTYDVLESLEKRGFVIQKLGKPVKYMAVKPSVVIEKLKNDTVKIADEKIQVLSGLKDTREYDELQKLHDTGIEPIKGHEMSSAIKGRSNLYAQIRATIDSASDSVYIASSAYELKTKEKMFREVFAKLNKRKVDIKIIIPESDSDEADKLSKKLGAPIKSKKLNARFVLVDRKEIIFTVKPTNVHEDFDYGFWINSEYFTNSLAFMFDLAWKN